MRVPLLHPSQSPFSKVAMEQGEILSCQVKTELSLVPSIKKWHYPGGS